MKNKKNGFFNKVIFFVTILCTLISSTAILVVSVFAAERSVNNAFVGYFENMSKEAIHAETNAEKCR